MLFYHELLYVVFAPHDTEYVVFFCFQVSSQRQASGRMRGSSRSGVEEYRTEKHKKTLPRVEHEYVIYSPRGGR